MAFARYTIHFAEWHACMHAAKLWLWVYSFVLNFIKISVQSCNCNIFAVYSSFKHHEKRDIKLFVMHRNCVWCVHKMYRFTSNTHTHINDTRVNRDRVSYLILFFSTQIYINIEAVVLLTCHTPPSAQKKKKTIKFGRIPHDPSLVEKHFKFHFNAGIKRH